VRDSWSPWLARLGRLLPDRLRECVFEPACYDLVRDTLERRRAPRLLTPRLVGILVQVAVANFPAVLFEGRRPSRLALLLTGSILIGSLTLMTLAIVIRTAYGY